MRGAGFHPRPAGAALRATYFLQPLGQGPRGPVRSRISSSVAAMALMAPVGRTTWFAIAHPTTGGVSMAIRQRNTRHWRWLRNSPDAKPRHNVPALADRKSWASTMMPSAMRRQMKCVEPSPAPNAGRSAASSISVQPKVSSVRCMAQDWLGFATVYNGPGNAEAYAARIAAAHAEARQLLESQ